MAESKALVPNFLWAQDKKNVYVKIDLTDVPEKDTKVEITKEGLSFTGTSHNKLYHLEFKFRCPIKPTTAKYSIKRLVTFLFEKDSSSTWWPHLLAEDDKKKYKSACKIDWEKFIDEDDASKKGLDVAGDDWQDYGNELGGMDAGAGAGAGMNDDDAPPEDDSESEDNEENDDAPIDGIDEELNDQKDASHDAEHDHSHDGHDHAHPHDHSHDHSHGHSHDHPHDHSHGGHEHCQHKHDHPHKQEETATENTTQQEKPNEEIEEVN